ncbi:MAG: hypothetical protein Q8Q84_22835 [Hydrogenophaga sp.]|nr:hypothetical protein [Hydrogenophaga sp.]
MATLHHLSPAAPSASGAQAANALWFQLQQAHAVAASIGLCCEHLPPEAAQAHASPLAANLLALLAQAMADVNQLERLM